MSNPLITWQRLRAGNENLFAPGRGHLNELTAGGPTAAVFRCADSGGAGEMVFGQGCSLTEVATWGHMVDTGVIATLEFAVETLAVPLIVVLGHHDCPAMRIAMRAWNNADMPHGATRTMVEQAMGSIVRRGARTDSLEAVSSAHIVETGLGILERSPLIARRVDAGRCGIVCATTTESGRIRAYATVGSVGEVSDSLLECV